MWNLNLNHNVVLWSGGFTWDAIEGTALLCACSGCPLLQSQHWGVGRKESQAWRRAERPLRAPHASSGTELSREGVRRGGWEAPSRAFLFPLFLQLELTMYLAFL